MVMIALVAVFLGGLMIGRTPEYLGKKITCAETRFAVLYALLTPKVVLVLTGVARSSAAGRAGLVTNTGTRGFTEVLFAYASSMANNGQTMAGLNANTVFYNATTAVAMLADDSSGPRWLWPWPGDSQPSGAGPPPWERCPAIPRCSESWFPGPSCWWGR